MELKFDNYFAITACMTLQMRIRELSATDYQTVFLYCRNEGTNQTRANKLTQLTLKLEQRKVHMPSIFNV